MATVKEYNQGALKHYGPYTEEEQYGAVTRVAGVVKQIVQPITYDNLPAGSTNDQTVPVIPANSFIVSARTYEEVAFDSTSGTTTLDLGLEQADGTDIDLDGLAADFATADDSSAGWTVGAGALVGDTVGANDAQIVVTPSVSDLTAGKGYAIIEYIEAPNI